MQSRPRVYAISSKNKILTTYIATLALVRLAALFMWVDSSLGFFTKIEVLNGLPLIPINTSKLCFSKLNLRYKYATTLVGTALGTQSRKDAAESRSRRMRA